MDVEENGTQTFAPRACRVVCEGLKKEGYEVGVYSSLSWWNSYLTEIKEYIRWVAHWNPTCGYTGDYLIWQYGTAQIDGIKGEVDANIYYADTDSSISSSKKTNKAVTTTSPDVIYQVYTDKHGWLSTVKNLEDYAGLDGEAIKGIRLFVNGDSIETVTHQMENGAIDKVTISSLGRRIRYRVRPIGESDYLSWMENKIDLGGSKDTFAGIEGKEIDRLQIVIKR